MTKRKRSGKVYLVGAGPGDPTLITVRGADLIRSADVVIVDALVSRSLIRKTKAKIIYVGKRGPGAPTGASVQVAQSGINKILVREAKKGQRIVRLKGGDPIVFGRSGEELEALKKAGVRYELVPGITSPIAVPAYAGIPVSDRRWSSHVTFLTGQESKDRLSKTLGVDWSKLPKDGTLVLLMGVSRWSSIRKNLLDAGWSKNKPVAAIENGTTPKQRTLLTTLEYSAKDFRKNKLVAPSIIVIGDVANLSKRFSWIEKEKPLLGRKIVVTRAEFQASRLTRLLQDKGAEVILCPSIEIEPILDNAELNKFYASFGSLSQTYDWVVFLSANAARIFSDGLAHHASDTIFKLGHKKPLVCSVGPQTSQVIENRGWQVNKTASVYKASDLLKVLKNVRGKRILVPRVERAPQEFIRSLRSKGARVKELPIYRNRPAAKPPSQIVDVLLSGVDAVTFTSASTVHRFMSFFTKSQRKRIFKTSKPVVIGPTTEQALRKYIAKKPLKANQSTLVDLVSTLCRKIDTK